MGPQPSDAPHTSFGADLRGMPGQHGLLAQAVAFNFQILGIGASLFDGGREWHAIHSLESVQAFELAHGMGLERLRYNSRSIERVRRHKRPVLGRHAGYCDLFVPVGARGAVEPFIITGPFATRRPTSAEIQERWRAFTGHQGHPSDPEFAHYVSMSLGTLTLEGDALGCYTSFLECFASLLAGRGDARATADRAAALGAKLEQARVVERTWEAARSMVDERSARKWLSLQLRDDLHRFGVGRFPEHALVGLCASRADAPDVVEEMLRRDALQRACVDLARDAGGAICGRVGDHGVMLLGAPRRALLGLGERAASLAHRRLGLSLHLGASGAGGAESLGERYRDALAAAERALLEGLPLAVAEPDKGRSTSLVRRLRAQLGAFTEERPKALCSRFERYIEAVALHCGYRLEVAGAHLEAGFDQAAQALLATGALAERSYVDACEGLERAARAAANVRELFGAYRLAISDLVDLVEHPSQAAQDTSLRRAVAFIDQRFAEPLTLTHVARVAGFTPAYFCQLFKQREGVTFSAYVRQLRIERAKQLLASTDLSAQRVGQLSGFTLRPHFQRVFKQKVGMTPLGYRSSVTAKG